MPLITDQEARLEALAKAARDHGATWFGGGVLYLQPCSRRVFLPFVEQNFPHLLRRYQERYESSAYIRGAYLDIIRERIKTIRHKYGFALIARAVCSHANPRRIRNSAGPRFDFAPLSGETAVLLPDERPVD